MVGERMPVFKNTRDCPKRILIWLAISIALTMILTYVIGFVFKLGLLATTMAMLFSLVVGWYIMDHFGDYLFINRKSAPTKAKIDSYRKQPFPYRN